LFDNIIRQINSKQLYGKQVDWGCWVAPMYPNEIIDFITNHYENDSISRNRFQSIKRYIMNLNQDQKYGLVACEMS
jgi:hypothetical protein